MSIRPPYEPARERRRAEFARSRAAALAGAVMAAGLVALAGCSPKPAADPQSTATARNVTLESEVSPGSLYASGLIAAGGIVGLLGVCVKLYEAATDRSIPRFSEHNPLHHDPVSVVMFALLAFSLYYFARKPLK